LSRFWLLFGALFAAASACTTAEPGAGSNTNWLRSCAEDEQCDRGLSCRCGVCTAPCTDACPELPNAVCVSPGSPNLRAACGEESESSGICLPACGEDAPCASSQICSDGACLQLEASCPDGVELELKTKTSPLQARFGTLFSAHLYLPVAYDDAPVAWTEPAPPAAIVARVTSAGGEPVSACKVRFLAGHESGRVFPEATETGKNGEVLAYWVAGDESEQQVTVAFADAAGNVLSRTLAGKAYAHDEGARSGEPEATTSAHPSTVSLEYALPDSSRKLRVVLTPVTFPHHAFYSAVNIDGFFAGLQNTSESNDVTDVPDTERVLIASVWNLAAGDAQLLYSVQGAACGAHGQDLGGIRCTLDAAWAGLGGSYVLELERTKLAMGDSVAAYAELGYLTEPCANPDGCTDYSLFFGPAEAAGEPPRIVAYRYQSAEVASSFGSFIQSYSELPAQNSCLVAPSYEAIFQPFIQTSAGLEPVALADFDASYSSWHNDVCANYAATVSAQGFRLSTGGPTALGPPILPDEPSRPLELP
jgi:hypothetical protein